MRHHLRTDWKRLTGPPPADPPGGPRPGGPAGVAAPSRLRGAPGRWAPNWRAHSWWARGRILAAVLTPLLLVAGVVAGVAAPASADTVPAPPSGWTTVFSDDFSGPAGSGADSNWTYDTGTQYNGTGCAANYGTGEVESNTSSAANVAEDGQGHLNITPVNSGGAWTSGRIETQNSSFEAPPGGGVGYLTPHNTGYPTSLIVLN